MAFNILVVDDSLPMRSFIKKTIKASGFDVGQFFEADNGQNALEILRREWLDIVLTDYNMPEMNGLELITEMQKEDLLKVIPVVMVTTEGSQQRIEEFMEKGAMAYIKKPFYPEEIRQQLNKIMGEPEHGDQAFDDDDEDLDF